MIAKVIALVACWFAVSSGAVLKIGAVFHTSGTGAKGRDVLELYKTWANSSDNTRGYTIETTVVDYVDEATTPLADAVTGLVTGGSMVDVLFCPYLSSKSIACADAVPTAFTGPIMIWGGASDAIFASGGPCDGKNCFGFFSVASTYMSAPLVALNDAYSSDLNVAIMTNSNSFSKSVASGANASIQGAAGIMTQSYTEFSAYKAALAEADLTAIDTAMDMMPDVVVIAGHNLDVEPAVERVKAHSHSPKAVIATNGFTAPANYGTDTAAMDCLTMPDQWARGATADPAIGWTTAAFNDAIDGDATTYHSASAGAACVAIANAMSSSQDLASGALATRIAALDIESFYGKINFATNGATTKPMYAYQYQGASPGLIVAPASVKASGTIHKEYGCTGVVGMAAATTTATTNTVNGAVGMAPLCFSALTLLVLFARQ